MFRSSSVPNKFAIQEQTLRSSKAWEDGNMYKTSYQTMSELNVSNIPNPSGLGDEKLNRTAPPYKIKQLKINNPIHRI
jgi:hypothetical protein